MDILEYIDPLNKDHMKAIKYLDKNGQWPKYIKDDIIDLHITFSQGWDIRLMNKLANSYIKQFLGDEY